ncbi:MAG: AraC family transcriptional regulator [Gammaproteobacteria bacterium]
MISTFSATISHPTRPHTHVVHEFIAGARGSALLDVNGSKYEISEHQTILVPAGVAHHYELADQQQAAEVTFVCFDSASLNSNKVTAAPMGDAIAAETALLIRLLKQALEGDDPHSREKAEHFLASILVNHRACRQGEEGSDRSGKRRKIQQTLDWINHNLSNDLSIDATAARSHMSRSTFTRCFKQHTSLSFSEYVTSARLRMASKLLAQDKLPIDEVAWRSGFKNIGHFYTRFHKQFGMTPRQYRKVSI